MKSHSTKRHSLIWCSDDGVGERCLTFLFNISLRFWVGTKKEKRSLTCNLLCNEEKCTRGFIKTASWKIELLNLLLKAFFFYFCKAVCLNLCWWWLIDHKGVLVCLFSGFMIVPWVQRASVFWSLLLWRSTPGADLLVVCSFYRSLQFGWDLMTDIVLFTPTFIFCDQVGVKSAA